MANEIIVGPGNAQGTEYPLLFLIPIPALDQIEWGGTGVKVIHTPSDNLPDWTAAQVANGDIAAAWITGFDTGIALFYVYTFTKPTGMTNPDLVAMAQSRYAEFEVKALTAYANIYAHAGTRIHKE